MKTEAETRKDLIDEALRLAGWSLSDPAQVAQEYAIDVSLAAEPPPEPWGDDIQYADYCLILRGRIVAVVEAKRTSKEPQLGQEQGLQYAQRIQHLQGGALPFVLYTNGHETWLWESDYYPPVKVRGFPSPSDLEWLDQRRAAREPLAAAPIAPDIAGRPYQVAAIRAVLESLEARRRRFLLVMATGTGKTRTAMGLIDVLLRARWAKRVLFLVDRVALRDQAIDAFREHLPDSPYWPRAEGHGVETAWAGNRRLYCTTYPTMLNLIEAGTTPATRGACSETGCTSTWRSVSRCSRATRSSSSFRSRPCTSS
jgi:type I restriction enzyme, R subunit